MRSKLAYIAVVVGLSIAGACNSNSEQVDTKPKKAKYTDSELTLFMRSMETEAKQWRAQIIDGQQLELPKGLLDSITISEPTPDKIRDKEKFDAHATFFQQHIDSLKLAPQESLPERYNLMVTACVDCHQSFCPGPIKRIKKLYIQQ